MKRTLLTRLALGLALTGPLAANAIPITLSAGESALFDFDLRPAVSLPPLVGVTFNLNPDGIGLGDAGRATCYDGLGASGSAFSCPGGAVLTDSGFLDGLFSMLLEAVTGEFSVDPDAVGLQTRVVSGVSLPAPTLPVPGTLVPLPPTSVPEPGSFALLGLGLATFGLMRWRRRATS